MRRSQLFEIEDQPWCPRWLRDCATDFLQHMLDLAGNYAAAVPRLGDLLRRSGHTQVGDLCSGGGGPWVSLLREVSADGIPDLSVRLSDLYPNREALARMGQRTAGMARFHPEPVDATPVPASLTVVRTMFSCFHHF